MMHPHHGTILTATSYSAFSTFHLQVSAYSSAELLRKTSEDRVDVTHDDRPALRISSVLSKFTAITELSLASHPIHPSHRKPSNDDNSPRMQHLPLDPIVIPHTLRDGIHRFTRLQIQPNRLIRLFRLLLQSHNSILDIESSIRS